MEIDEIIGYLYSSVVGDAEEELLERLGLV